MNKYKKPIEDICKFLETFPKNIDKHKELELTEDTSILNFLKKIIEENQKNKNILLK